MSLNYRKIRIIEVRISESLLYFQTCSFITDVRLSTQQAACGPAGGAEWIDKSPSVQKCAEECGKKVGFINLIEYGRTDNALSICNEDGCDCKCVIGRCDTYAVDIYDLYEVTIGKFKSV